MNRFIVFVTLFLSLASATFAVDRSWTPTGNSSNNFATGANWTGGSAPISGDRGLITNNSVSANETNISYRNGDYGIFGGSGDGVIVSNSNVSGSGINKFLVNTGHFEMHQLTVGRNGIAEIANGASLSAYRGSTLSSGGTLFINGSIFRMNGEDRPTFLIDGTMIANSGTYDGSPFSANNSPIQVRSGGAIIANSGSFYLNIDNAFTFGGLNIAAGGLVQANTNATLVLDRDTTAWTSGTAVSPTNSGTIFLNGGTVRTFDGGAANTTRQIVNASGGVIRGNGLLDFTVRNVGVIEARSGTLSTVAANGNLGTWVSTNFGGAESVLNFTSGNFDLGGGTLLNSNGTLRVVSSAVMTLSTSYRQNHGTINFAGAGEIFVANSPSAGALTNEFVIRKTGGGNSTITTGHGSGQENFPFINRGSITAGGGGPLTINTDNAHTIGFSNAANGTIEITTGTSQFQIKRTAAAWDNGDTPVNAGIIQFTASGGGGTLSMLEVSTITPTRSIRNVGVIQKVTTGASGTSTFNGSVINAAGGSIIVSNGTLANLRFTGNNEGLISIHGSGTLLTGTAGLTNAGLISLQGGVLELTNAAGGQAVQNLAAGRISGSGTLLFGRPPGENSYSLVNSGSILVSGGSLTLNSGNAFNRGGFANAGGTVEVASASTFVIRRENMAWTDPGANFPTNSAMILLSGGTLRGESTSGQATRFVNAATGTIRGNGVLANNFNTLINNGSIYANSASPLTVDSAFLINQAGGVVTASSGRIVVNGVFSNQSGANFAMLNSVGTFNARVVNSGGWWTDPSTNTFLDDFIVTSSGTIQMSAGDVYVFSNGVGTAASFLNFSTQSNNFNTLEGKFVFRNSLAITNTFVVAGKNIGALDSDGGFNTVFVSTNDFFSLAQFSNNFALGELDIDPPFGPLVITGPTAGNPLDQSALFLSNLVLDADAAVIISNNTQVYFISSNGWNSSQVSLIGNAGLHQLLVAEAVVPEPSTLLLLMGGAWFTYVVARRRRR